MSHVVVGVYGVINYAYKISSSVSRTETYRPTDVVFPLTCSGYVHRGEEREPIMFRRSDNNDQRSASQGRACFLEKTCFPLMLCEL